MSKGVYLQFDVRLKELKFESVPGISDWDQIRDEMLKTCLTDADLKRRMQGYGTLVLFQEERTIAGKVRMVDIDEKAKPTVEDQSIVFPIFCKEPEKLEDAAADKAFTGTPGLLQNDGSTVFWVSTNPQKQDQDIAGTLELNGVVQGQILADGSLPDGTIVTVTENPSTETENSEILSSNATEPDPDKKGEDSNLCVSTSSKKNKNKKSQVKKQGAHKEGSTSCSLNLSLPIRLPQLPENLKKYVQKGLVFEQKSEFYAHYAVVFRSLCPKTSNRNDHDAFAREICKRHPELLNQHHPTRQHGTASRHLSIAVINNRAQEKRNLAKHLKENNEESPDEPEPKKPRKGRTKTTSSASMVSCGAEDESLLTEAESSNIQKHLEELQKVAHMGATSHVVRLVKATFSYRMKTLKTMDSHKASEALAAFPFLKNFDLVTLDLSLRLERSYEDLSKQFEKCLLSLATFFKIPEAVTHEQGRAEIMERLQTALKPNRISKRAKATFIVREALQSIEDDLDTIHEDTPRLMMYIDKETKKMCSAFIVADASVELKIENPNVLKCFMCLIGAYHSWNIGYGPVAKNMMCFLDEEVLGLKTKNTNNKFRDFQAEWSATCST